MLLRKVWSRGHLAEYLLEMSLVNMNRHPHSHFLSHPHSHFLSHHPPWKQLPELNFVVNNILNVLYWYKDWTQTSCLYVPYHSRKKWVQFWFYFKDMQHTVESSLFGVSSEVLPKFWWEIKMKIITTKTFGVFDLCEKALIKLPLIMLHGYIYL